jgi:hypothetical protein
MQQGAGGFGSHHLAAYPGLFSLARNCDKHSTNMSEAQGACLPYLRQGIAAVVNSQIVSHF